MTNDDAAANQLTSLLESVTPGAGVLDVQTKAPGPSGALPLTDEIPVSYTHLTLPTKRIV